MIATEGGAFYDPQADHQCFESIKGNIRSGIEVREMTTHINDPDFARACAESLLEMLGD